LVLPVSECVIVVVPAGKARSSVFPEPKSSVKLGHQELPQQNLVAQTVLVEPIQVGVGKSRMIWDAIIFTNPKIPNFRIRGLSFLGLSKPKPVNHQIFFLTLNEFNLFLLHYRKEATIMQ